MLQKLVVILGPTAVGKTKFAVQLAHKFNGEIVSADSRQVYKLMDIGTGKDLNEYTINDLNIQYHLIDIVNPSDEYNLFSFQKDFYSVISKTRNNKTVPFLTGGTGLYINSILSDYQLAEVDFNSTRGKYLSTLNEDELINILDKLKPNQHNTTDIAEKSRIINAILIAENKSKIEKHNFEFDTLVIGVGEEREIIRQRITTRLKYRLENGMIDEVENLVKNGISFEKLDSFGLEYKLVGRYLKNQLSYNDMFQKLNSAIHQFSKRQMTWFRKMEREGIIINWMKFNEIEKAEKLIKDFLNKVNNVQ